MVRTNTRVNYGATRHAGAQFQTVGNLPVSTQGDSAYPPPPYSGFAPPTGLPQPNDRPPVAPPWSPFEPFRTTKRTASWLNTPSFVALLTFVIAVGLCMSTMPVTYCNDPADPQVRERSREEWSKEFLEHEKHVAEREVVKARWAWEDERHAVRLREWEQERIQHELKLKERARREEEERKRLDLFWGRVETHQCKTYGTREYTAVLMNLPMGWDQRVKACKATPLEVHGVTHMPTSCEDRGHGVVIGRWEIDQYEPDCNTYWKWYKDKGCTSPGSGKRRIEHYLENLPKGGDWREFCATTPARFHGIEFSGAQECFPQNAGAWGYWQIDDIDC